MKGELTPDDALDLIARRAAIRLSLLDDGFFYSPSSADGQRAQQKEWKKELEAVEAELVAAGLLKDVGEVGLGEVVTLRGSNFHTETEATTSSPTHRPCPFCNGTGEKVVDMEIDGFTYEVTVDCYHPYDLP